LNSPTTRKLSHSPHPSTGSPGISAKEVSQRATLFQRKSLKTNKPRTKEVSQFFTPGIANPSPPFLRKTRLARSPAQKKWDTVPLLFPRNSLKTNNSRTKEPGHFFNQRFANQKASE
jgi:hypothetical protein